MTITDALRKILIDAPDVAGIVGNSVFAIAIPVGASVPAITIEDVITSRSYTMAAVSSLITSTYRFHVWALEYAQMNEAARAVAAALSGYAGVFDGGNIQAILVENIVPSYAPETRLYHKVVTCSVNYEEVV